MRKEFNFTGFPVQGHEEDYLNVFEKIGCIGISYLFNQLGIESSDWCTYHAIKSMPHHKDCWYNEYCKEIPKIYKVKITVETEEVSEEEAKKLWDKNRGKCLCQSFNGPVAQR